MTDNHVWVTLVPDVANPSETKTFKMPAQSTDDADVETYIGRHEPIDSVSFRKYWRVKEVSDSPPPESQSYQDIIAQLKDKLRRTPTPNASSGVLAIINEDKLYEIIGLPLKEEYETAYENAIENIENESDIVENHQTRFYKNLMVEAIAVNNPAFVRSFDPNSTDDLKMFYSKLYSCSSDVVSHYQKNY